MGWSSGRESMRVLQVSRGRPFTSAEHEPHLPALQFQRTAKIRRTVLLNIVQRVQAPPCRAQWARDSRQSRHLRGHRGISEASPRAIDVVLRYFFFRKQFACNSSGISGRRYLAQRPSHRPVATMTLFCFPHICIRLRDNRCGCGPRGFRDGQARCGSRPRYTMSMDFKSWARCQPGLNSREPSTRKLSPRVVSVCRSHPGLRQGLSRSGKFPTKSLHGFLQLLDADDMDSRRLCVRTAPASRARPLRFACCRRQER